jgi:murein DD-endopeptidase MepM/ murein hydrolase activator NlpD
MLLKGRFFATNLFMVFTLRHFCFFLPVFIDCFSVQGQSYVLPLDPPIDISASFGEARPNHFHAGIDFATGGKSLAVKSIADGYVERIKISPGGYGNAIYIRHPDSNISLYGHLERFSGNIADKILEIQAKNQFFELDEYFEESVLPVKKGQVIAYSGNSGSSSGPHLHFEIRGPGFETIHNPLRFGFPIKDNIKPVITAIYLVPFKKFGKVNGKYGALRISIIDGKPDPKVGRPTVEGWIGIAYEGYDGITRTGSRSLAYKTQVEYKEQIIFEKVLDYFGFDDSRCVNAALNYEELSRTKKKIYQCFEPVHHNSPIIKKSEHRGLLFFNQQGEHVVRLTIADYQGNFNAVNLNFQSKNYQPDGIVKASTGIIPGREDVLKFDGGSLFFNPNSLFDTTLVHIRKNGNMLQCGSYLTPVNESFILNWMLPHTFLNADTSKILLKIKSGSVTKHLKGSVNDGIFKVSLNLFGNYELVLDTVAPVITLLQATKTSPGALPTAKGRANFKVSDNASGIKHYTAQINKQWSLLSYDVKSGKMWLDFPSSLPKGIHNVEIFVTDRSGNQSVLKQQFVK